jgi:hypothetical protein
MGRADHLSFAMEDFSKPVITVIEVTDAGGMTASASIERRYASVGVRSLTVHDAIVGTLYQYDHSAPDLPPTLESIPLEYFEKALLWGQL